MALMPLIVSKMRSRDELQRMTKEIALKLEKLHEALRGVHRRVKAAKKDAAERSDSKKIDDVRKKLGLN